MDIDVVQRHLVSKFYIFSNKENVHYKPNSYKKSSMHIHWTIFLINSPLGYTVYEIMLSGCDSLLFT